MSLVNELINFINKKGKTTFIYEGKFLFKIVNMILIEYKILTILLYFNTIFGIFGKHLINTKNKNDDYCSNKLLCAKNEMINKPNNFDKIGELSRSKKTALCDACYLAVPIALKFVAENKTEHIKPFIVFICNEFKIESQMVCDLVVKEYAVGYKYIFLLSCNKDLF